MKQVLPSVLALAFQLTLATAAVPDEMLMVTVREGQHIRDVAREYLADPDLWAEILKLNGLSSVVELRPGMRLGIPRNQVSLATTELARALAAIEEAGAAGAQVLAAAALGEAAALRDRALTRRRQADWQACFELARAARQAADKALATARAARHLPAEALLSDRTGTVESRMPGDLVWRDAPLRSKLTEGEKVRTLSSSLAA
ncbi:MAG: LysM peptidoglycan-binding domain-containing protein, partial [bacterium]|nr:LysM peptidoglycan-binding domain-containing protein [bacterium]